ncbi:2OG-Fe dioxygenase family protein [Salinisphaera sp.]|uniref:2OG-Fe dioxygenase family protein n=1 Tax=Salinisphaera sp. TaxID=1914330 RepID=UPI0025FAC145|nr:2OG-Fe dioxygenase family protein [Salinisphaera sp.]
MAILNPSISGRPVASVSKRIDIDDVCRRVAKQSYALIDGPTVADLLTGFDSAALADWDAFATSWDNMPRDGHMADGGTYRRRRHATLAAAASSNTWFEKAHQPHYQGRDFNTLNGGIARHYQPIEASVLRGNTLASLVGLGCRVFGRMAPYYPWHIEVHQFRIETEGDFVGKPTPEGIHRDGVNFVIMAMVQHRNMASGESTVYDLGKNPLRKFTLNKPLDLAIVNDEQVFHGVSPISAVDRRRPAVRDVLVVTFRKQF